MGITTDTPSWMVGRWGLAARIGVTAAMLAAISLYCGIILNTTDVAQYQALWVSFVVLSGGTIGIVWWPDASRAHSVFVLATWVLTAIAAFGSAQEWNVGWTVTLGLAAAAALAIQPWATVKIEGTAPPTSPLPAEGARDGEALAVGDDATQADLRDACKHVNVEPVQEIPGQEGGSDGSSRTTHGGCQSDNRSDPLADCEAKPPRQELEMGPREDEVPGGPPSRSYGGWMETVTFAVALTALAVSVAALVAAVRGLLRTRR